VFQWPEKEREKSKIWKEDEEFEWVRVRKREKNWRIWEEDEEFEHVKVRMREEKWEIERSLRVSMKEEKVGDGIRGESGKEREMYFF